MPKNTICKRCSNEKINKENNFCKICGLKLESSTSYMVIVEPNENIVNGEVYQKLLANVYSELVKVKEELVQLHKTKDLFIQGVSDELQTLADKYRIDFDTDLKAMWMNLKNLVAVVRE